MKKEKCPSTAMGNYEMVQILLHTAFSKILRYSLEPGHNFAICMHNDNPKYTLSTP